MASDEPRADEKEVNTNFFSFRQFPLRPSLLLQVFYQICIFNIVISVYFAKVLKSLVQRTLEKNALLFKLYVVN